MFDIARSATLCAITTSLANDGCCRARIHDHTQRLDLHVTMRSSAASVSAEVINYLSACEWDICVAKIKASAQHGADLELSTQRYPVGAGSRSYDIAAPAALAIRPFPPTAAQKTLLLIRHGDREDYDRTRGERWKAIAKDAARLPEQRWKDPPLSRVGKRQALETAHRVAELVGSLRWPMSHDGVDPGIRVLSSPYLRCLQTASPTADLLDVPICVEDGLGESHYARGYLPRLDQRWAYFPQIDLDYTPMHVPAADGGVHAQAGVGACETFPDGYMRRIIRFGRKLTRMVDNEVPPGGIVVCFSHAASVALIAALLEAEEVPWKMAPTGIFRLERTSAEADAGAAWQLVGTNGGCNNHVTVRSPGTHAWGFDEEQQSRWPAAIAAASKEQ